MPTPDGKSEEVAGFKLLRLLGEGAASEVYLATPTKPGPFAAVGDPLAMKLYKQHILKDRVEPDRIRREFTVGSQLIHPNLVRIYDFDDGTRSEPAHLVMEYVDGLPLDRWIALFEPLPGRLVLKVFQQLLDAVVELHANGVIHRDIKPQNVMISNSFEIKLMDYGVVRITKDAPITDSDKFLGTIRNSSPEYLLGHAYDERTDFYSLGTVLYALLHGYEVFHEETQFARLIQRVGEGVPAFDDAIAQRDDARCAGLLTLAKGLLAKEPAKRPTLEQINSELQKLAPAPEGLADPLNGYIATALTGLSDDASDSVTWVSHHIAQVAKQYDVYVYQPRLASDPVMHRDVQPIAVYLLDRKRVASSDILFLLANKPSFGAGQEIEIGASYNKPTIIVAKKGTKISRMLLGSVANIVEVIYYEKPEDLERHLRSLFSQRLTEIKQSRRLARRSSAVQVGGRLKELRLANRFTTVEEMGAAIGMSPRILHYLESGELDNPGVRLLSYIARSLGTTLSALLSETDLQPVGASSNPSLRNLEKVASDAGWSAAHYLELRDDLLRQAAASGESSTISTDMWLNRHAALEKRHLGARNNIAPATDQQQLFDGESNEP